MDHIMIILLASCTILHFNVPSIRSDSTEEDNEKDEGDYESAYMDALVKTLEFLFSIKANFQSIAREVKRIHEKLGVDVMEPEKLLDESLAIIERHIEMTQNKFQADGITIGVMAEKLLKTEVYDTLTKNLETLKQQVELMENQFIHEMVETIKEQANQGVSDLYKFQDQIESEMQIVDAAAATAETTSIRLARVYGTTTTPLF